MRFSIITPRFRNSEWLKLCIASIADQGVDLEHIVQDAGSDDGTLDWLLKDSRVKAFVEKDEGMYDAVNRGLRRASGDICAYLNCDEQYLPGALQGVEQFFQSHPEVDVLFADTIVVDGDGGYICHRKVQLPLRYHTWVSHLSTFTCATFFRRKLISEAGLFFDTRWRALGDCDWVLRLLERRVPMAVLRQFTSTFTETGDNLCLSFRALQEQRQMFESAPAWARKTRRLIETHHRLRRWLGGIYSQEPFHYSIYTRQSPAKRVSFDVTQPTFLWKQRLQAPSALQPSEKAAG